MICKKCDLCHTMLYIQFSCAFLNVGKSLCPNFFKNFIFQVNVICCKLILASFELNGTSIPIDPDSVV